MEEKKEVLPIEGLRGSGTEIAYSVEARYNFHQPKQFAGMILDNRWKTLHFDKSPIGVPVGNGLNPVSVRVGLLSFQAAQGLRWWFHAQADIDSPLNIMGDLCIETRIVKHEVAYSYSEKKVSYHEEVGGAFSSRGPKRLENENKITR